MNQDPRDTVPPVPPVRRVRPVRPEEWREVRELRLAALRDPAAPIAFLETYEQAAAQPDSFWQERAERAAGGAGSGPGVRQFVAESADGTWSGTATALIEEAGTQDVFGTPVDARQAHIVGVFVRPEHRGAGVIDALFAAAVDWAGAEGVTRVRLYVHQDNARAERFYRRFGFVRSGWTAPMKDDPSASEIEMVLDPAAGGLSDRPHA